MPAKPRPVTDKAPQIAVTKPLDDRGNFARLLVRLTIYYSVIAAALFVLISIFPGLIDQLPIGGVNEIEGSGIVVENADRIQFSPPPSDETVSSANRLDDALDLLIAMTGVLLLMLPVAWVYRSSNYQGSHDHSLDETAFVLPVVVAGIVIVVQHSLALAFSLAGIVAGVRFRRALKDTYDALYILMAIGVGIAAGVKALDIAAVLSIFFNYTTLMVCTFGDGLESHHRRSRKMAGNGKSESKADDE